MPYSHLLSKRDLVSIFFLCFGGRVFSMSLYSRWLWGAFKFPCVAYTVTSLSQTQFSDLSASQFLTTTVVLGPVSVANP